MTFCSVMQTIYSADFWTWKVAYYLAGVSFAFKRNPLEVAVLKQRFGENVAKDYHSAAQQRAIKKELVVLWLNFL